MFEDFVLEIQSDEMEVLAAFALWARTTEDEMWRENFDEEAEI